MPTPTFRFRSILNCLLDHRADFIVVGGVAAVLHGAPINTFDMDIVHARTEENIPRLLDALAELDAIYRELPARRLRPTRSHLVTRFGSLDLLGTIGDDLGYDDLLVHSSIVKLTQRRKIRVLNLAYVIATKEAAGRQKDKAVLPILRDTLRQKEAKDAGEDK